MGVAANLAESPRREEIERERCEERERTAEMAEDTMTTKTAMQGKGNKTPVKFLKYCTDLRTSVETDINAKPRAFVHSREWKKIMNGDPVEINPSVGHGLKIMTVDEWSARWKRNDDFPDCLACGSLNTKEHHFIQTWCRGKRRWESETLCLDCHSFSWRKYCDPGFTTPAEYEKQRWNQMIEGNQSEMTLKA